MGPYTSAAHLETVHAWNFISYYYELMNPFWLADTSQQLNNRRFPLFLSFCIIFRFNYAIKCHII
jgi:hypothetical protein